MYSIKKIIHNGSIQYRVDFLQNDGFKTTISYHVSLKGAKYMVNNLEQEQG